MEGEQDIYSVLCKILTILKEEDVINPKETSAVVNFEQPDKLKELLSLSLNETCEEKELLEICRKVVKYSIKTGHPYFLNQLYGGMDIYGLAGAIVSESLNTNQYTFEVAPAFTLCELEVINRTLQLVGFQNGDGIFCPGGSISNMYAMVLARFEKFPEIKKTGLSGIPPFVVFTSEDAHYSITKGAHWLGIGTDNVIKIKTDINGRMLPDQLDEAITIEKTKGHIPLLVNTTAGTTVLGSFDPFADIHAICNKHSIWMHVDSCWGGSLMFSKKYKSHLHGINRADSISWNPHKMLGAPLQCSMVIVKKKGLLDACNMARATYLFQPDKMYDTNYDTGDKSIQCGRKVDAFKLWIMWKYRGDTGFGQLVDNAIDLSRYFLLRIKSRPGFKLVLPEFQTSNICFWYIPKRLRDQEENDDWWEQIHNVAPILKRKLVEDSCLMIGYQPLAHKNLKNFFRLVITCHPSLEVKHMDKVIDMLELHGAEI